MGRRGLLATEEVAAGFGFGGFWLWDTQGSVEGLEGVIPVGRVVPFVREIDFGVGWVYVDCYMVWEFRIWMGYVFLIKALFT